jgi:hypothetical protein
MYGVGVNGGNKSATLTSCIAPNGNFAAFTDTVGSFSELDLSSFMVWYSDTVPAVADNTAGFSFTQGSFWHQFSSFKNIVVKGATYVYYDITGSYMARLERVWGWNCLYGFYKNGGTTYTFDNCYTLGGAKSFQMFNVLASTFTCCASDGMTVTDTVYGGNCFSGCLGLTINGWDNESNTVAPNGKLFRFINNTGVVNGITGVNNTLQTTGGANTQAIFCTDGNRLVFSGCKMAYQAGYLAVTGTGGSVFTFQTGGTANYISMDCCSFVAPTGGSPALVYSVASTENSLSYKNCDLSGGNIVNCQSLDRTHALYVPVITDSSASGTSTTTLAVGEYSTVGNICTFKLQMTQSVYSVTGASQAYISLPVPPDTTANSGDNIPIAIYSSGLTLPAGAQLLGVLNKTTGKIHLNYINAGVITVLPTSTTGFATASFVASGSYICNLFPSA